MLIIKTLPSMRRNMRFLRKSGKRIALIPTMGNLHNGHMRLVDEARKKVDVVVVSIFVNPMQFDRVDDLVYYPRTLKKDYKKLNDHHVDFVFSPVQEDIYPQGTENITFINVPGIANILEGAYRPNHFRGVTTIISKLFNLVQPDVAYFGEKDFQQLALIRKMVTDLCYDINIVGIPIVREKDGLALSSRNSYLTDDQRKIGSILNEVMNEMAKYLQKKELTIKEIISLGKQKLNSSGFYDDDLQIRDADTLLELTKSSQRAVILMAAWLGKARLIDNKVIDLVS